MALPGLISGCDDAPTAFAIRDVAFIDGATKSIGLNQTATLQVRILPHETPYDNAANPEHLVWSSTNEAVAAVDDRGTVTGLSVGTTKIRAASRDSRLSATIQLQVVSNEQVPNLDKPLGEAIIFNKGVQLVRNSVIQGFDMDSDDAIYYVQIAGTDEHQLNIIKSSPYTGTPAKHYDSYMACSYFGHGTNIALEESGDDRYIWIGCYGSRDSGTDSYSYSQTVARVKYEAGKVLTPAQCADQYYIPGVRNIHPAIDAANDLIAFTSSGGDEKGRWFRIYRLSEIKALPTSKVTLKSIRYGGATSSDPEVTQTPTVEVHDLNRLMPVGMFGVMENSGGTEAVGYYSFQGFDVKGDRIYYYEGVGNENDGKVSSNACVTVFDFRGNILKLRTPVAAVSDMEALAANGITTTGYMEAEGIRVEDDRMYLGFASKSTDNIRRTVILQYDLQ